MVSKNHPLARAVALALFGAASSLAATLAQAQQTPSEQVQANEANANASTAQTSAVTIALINELVKQGILSLDRAKALLEAAEHEAAMTQQRQAPPPPNQVRVPYVPESVKKEMREELRKEIVAEAKEE